jgi:hypothetical protein
MDNPSIENFGGFSERMYPSSNTAKKIKIPVETIDDVIR